MRLLIDMRIELPHERAGFREVCLLEHLIVDVDLLRVGEITVILALYRMGQPAADIGERVDDILAVGLQHYGEVTAAHQIKLWTDRNHFLRRFDTDLAPFVDQPGADDLVGLIDVAIEELERKILLSRLLQKSSSLGTRFLDVGPEAN